MHIPVSGNGRQSQPGGVKILLTQYEAVRPGAERSLKRDLAQCRWRRW